MNEAMITIPLLELQQIRQLAYDIRDTVVVYKTDIEIMKDAVITDNKVCAQVIINKINFFNPKKTKEKIVCKI